MPGESPAVFGDALRRLAGAATFLYQDGSRYWYSTQPTVTKLAEDRAEQLKREPDKVTHEIDARLRKDLGEKKGDFSRVHPMPHGGQDVPDDLDARLVVLSVEHPYSKEEGNRAQLAARAIFENRGNTPRLYRNALVFLAADKTRLQDLDEAARRYLAWQSILDEKVALNLDPQQVKQAETQRASADGAVTARVPETYQWLLVPTQETPQTPVSWQALRLSGSDPLAVRASKKLRSDDLLATTLAGTMLRMWLDKIPLWRGDHVPVRQLTEDFARYCYLPRLRDADVLLDAVRSGLGLLTWEQDSFAWADSWDEATGRYRGLRGGQHVSLDAGSTGLLVKPHVACAQLEAERRAAEARCEGTEAGGAMLPEGRAEGGAVPGKGAGAGSAPVEPEPVHAGPKRYHGTVTLDATRVGRDASRIADEVISHLVGLLGARVTVTLEIEAELPEGAPDNVVRTVTENGRTLRFTSQGFEKE
jgi:hypothetical protein